MRDDLRSSAYTIAPEIAPPVILQKSLLASIACLLQLLKDLLHGFTSYGHSFVRGHSCIRDCAAGLFSSKIRTVIGSQCVREKLSIALLF